MNADGTYLVTYKAVDLQGNTTTQNLVVNVKTPQEVLDQIAAEQAAQQAALEQAAAQTTTN